MTSISSLIPAEIGDGRLSCYFFFAAFFRPVFFVVLRFPRSPALDRLTSEPCARA